MATKRKSKPKEPILNSEPLNSSRGVIVTHPEKHITPGNASITWLVVMMAIIGVVGAFCTYIWWQKEDLNTQIEAPYMQDQGHTFTKFMRSMRERMMSNPVANVPSATFLTLSGLSMDLAIPTGWSAIQTPSDVSVNTVYLSKDAFEARFSADGFVVRRPDVIMTAEHAGDPGFDVWVQAQTEGWENVVTKEISVPGVAKAVLVQGRQKAPTNMKPELFTPAPYAYFLSLEQKNAELVDRGVDSPAVQYFVKIVPLATIYDYTNVSVPNPNPDQSYPYITTDFRSYLDFIFQNTKWNP